MNTPKTHNTLDEEHHNLIAKHYDRLIVSPRKTINDHAFKSIERHLPERIDNMLDLGAGTGHMSVRYGTKCSAITLVDHSEQMLLVAKHNTRHLNAKIEIIRSEALAYLMQNKRKFNIIACVGFLHHLETIEQRKLFALLKESLTLEGKILLAEPVATKITEPKIIQWWNKKMKSNIDEYISLAPTPDEAPVDLNIIKQNYTQAGFSSAIERRGWEIFTRFNNNIVDKLAIRILDRLFHKDGVVWISVLTHSTH